MTTEGPRSLPPTQAQLHAFARLTSAPPNEVPVVVPVRVVLTRRPDLVVSLLGARVHTTGLLLELVVQYPGLQPTEELARALRAPRLPRTDPQALAAGVRYADGRGTTLSPRSWSPEREARASDPSQLLLTAAAVGGADGQGSEALALWLAPLPSGGPVVLAVSWPALGLAEVTVELDGDLLADAGRTAEVLWPAPARVVPPAVVAQEQARARALREHPEVPGVLAGVAWTLVGLRDGRVPDVERDVSAAGARLAVDGDGRFTGRTGNSFVGYLVVQGDRLRVLERAGHLALFSGLRGELEPVVDRVLMSRPRWSVDGERLVLVEDDGVTLVFRKRSEGVDDLR